MSVVDKVLKRIDGSRDEMIEFASDIFSIPAIAPQSGGDGEMKKVKRILKLVGDWGFDEVMWYNAPDDRVPGGERPNLLLKVKGSEEGLEPLWVFAHTDVVPPGDKWTSDPWKLRIEGERMICRGVEDNGQAIVCSLFALRAVLEEGGRPKRDINIMLVADEEVGSEKGITYLLDHHGELFGKDHLFLVPDAGEADGSMIEVAEKSIVWLRIKTIGKTVHASMPDKGINANLAAMRFLTMMYDELHDRYPDREDLFDPPISTFEPTRREANVPNVNSIPGEDISYYDCRIMPQYDPYEVLDHIRMRANDFGAKHHVRFEITTEQMERAAPPTSADHPIVKMIAKAVKEVYGVDATAQGIGGGTCAAILRRAGYPSAVWGKMEDCAHMPDEFAPIENYIGDAKVFARIFMS